MIAVLQPNQKRIPMATITQVAETLQKVLGDQVEVLARESGFIQRQVTVTGSGFVQAMVMSFQGNQSPSYSEISQSASSLGMPMSAQGIEQRLNERCAQFMKAVLEVALKEKVSGITKSAVPILEKFNGVHLRDSSTIGLPASLKEVWRGTGNQNAETAALKLQVSWEYSHGALDGLVLQAGCCQDQTSPAQRLELPVGALHLGDLGYFSLDKLARDSERGVFGSHVGNFGPRSGIHRRIYWIWSPFCLSKPKANSTYPSTSGANNNSSVACSPVAYPRKSLINDANAFENPTANKGASHLKKCCNWPNGPLF